MQRSYFYIVESPSRMHSEKPDQAGAHMRRIFARRVVRWISRRLRRLGRWKSLTRPSFAPDLPQGSLNRYIRSLECVSLVEQREIVLALVGHVCDHRFNLLGSGWVQVLHGAVCRGVEGHRYRPGPAVRPDPRGVWLQGRINRANLEEAQRIWALVDPEYVPIDWQLDFKSGYRWSEKAWYLDISYAYGPGVDIKVPWELARLQHLPWLGLAQALTPQPGSASPVYAREFRNQVLDFIANNPPGFGVNWRCTMDVAIRAANLLLAYDLFRAGGMVFDPDFDVVFMRSILEHGRHIVANLEWDEELHGNHYLANIAGLAFVAAYLPRSAETDAWLAFSAQELVREVAHQFNADGTNFEASVCYHRLAAEMVLFATAILSNLPQEKYEALASYDPCRLRVRPSLDSPPVSLYPVTGGTRRTPFPQWYWERLERMAEFTMHLTKPDGLVTQFGDNDSGRFIKLGLAMRELTQDEMVSRYINLAGHDPGCNQKCLDEVDLDHRHLVAGINAFFDREDLAAFAPKDIGGALVSELAGGIQVASYRGAGAEPPSKTVRIGADEDWSKLLHRFSMVPEGSRRSTVFSAAGFDLRNRLELFAYPDFGAYVFRSPRLFLALRCGSVGQNGIGGHAHLDQLTLELVIDGQTLVSDPGTYLYTPLPERRNAYRSARAHFVPRVPGREPGDMSRGLFRLDGVGEGECLYFGPLGFAGRHFGYGEAVYRLVAIESDRVMVLDFTESGAVLEDPTPEKLPFSPGYGKQCRHRLE